MKALNTTNKAEIIFGDYEGNEEYAILMLYDGKKYVLFPTQLVTMLLHKEGKLIASCKDGDYWNGNTVFFYDEVDHYNLILTDYADKKASYLVFQKAEIHEAIKQTFMQLYEALNKGCNTLYKDHSVNLGIMESYMRNLNNALLLSQYKYYGYGTKVGTSEFAFACEPESVDFPYTLTFGNFKVKSYISDWGTNLTQLRKDLEMAREIRLFFICFPNNYDTEDPYIAGKSIELVEIKPNEFCDNIVIFGLSTRRQVVKAIYEGLLRMVRYEFKSIDYWGTWDDLDNITFCNKIKSPLIEDFINGKYFDNKNIELRQVVIEHILTISPDFDVLYYDEKSCADSFYDDGKIIVDVGSNDRKEVLIPGFEQWYNEYIEATDFVDCTTDQEFDYADWEKRGLEFAKQLREQLPDSIDLWYEPPFEDKKRKEAHAKLIYKDHKAL